MVNLHATGFVTGADGTATMSAHHEGHNMIPGGTDVLLGNGLSRGNGFHAEVQFVIRSHGAIIAALTSCLDGPDQPTQVGCVCPDLDQDNDVDLFDYGLFQFLLPS